MEARPASGPGSSPPMAGWAGTASETGANTTSPAAGPAEVTELQVAFSAYNTRDICAWDPTMRIRHLKLVASGPSSVVYKGTWQGMLVAVRFTLLRGACGVAAGVGPGSCGSATVGDSCGARDLPASSTDALLREQAAQTAYRRVCAMLASHCTPQRSHCTRVYACDVSHVARAAAAAPSALPLGGGAAGSSNSCMAASLTVVACDWAAGAEPHDTGLSSPQPHLLPRSIHSSLDDSGASGSSEHSHGQGWLAEQQRGGSALAGSSRLGSGHADDLEQSGSSCCGSGGSSNYSSATALSAVRGSAGGAGGVVGCGGVTSAASSAHLSSHLPRSSSHTPPPAAALPPASRFHFSSLLCGCPPPATYPVGGDTAAQQQQQQQQQQQHDLPLSTLQGLLAYLRAAPGDYLLHTVLEQGCCGDLRHGVRCGVYDAQGTGPLGPRGAMTNLVHSARGVAAGLQQLHQAGEVHGGLCPGNVLLHWSGPNGPSHTDEGGDVVMLAGALGGAEPAHGRSSNSGGGERRRKRRRGLFAARITDCGLRRLVLGSEWPQQLAAHPDLMCCTAPELLPPVFADSTAAGRQGSQAGAEPQWQPHHDIYSFGCLLFLMCTGGLPNSHRLRSSATNASTGNARAPSDTASPSSWPANVWPPLRSLGEACMSADPTLRPTASRVVQVLLLWESRLCSSRQQQLLQYEGARVATQQQLQQQHTRLNVSAPDFPALAAAAAIRTNSGHAPAVARDGGGAAATLAAASSGCSTVQASALELHSRVAEQQQVAMRLPGRAGSGGGRCVGGGLVLGVGSGAFSHTLDSVAEAEMTACGSGCSSGTEERLNLEAETQQPAHGALGHRSLGDGGRIGPGAMMCTAPAHTLACRLGTSSRQAYSSPPPATGQQPSRSQPSCEEQQGASVDVAAAIAVQAGQPVSASRSRDGRTRVLHEMHSKP
ncbi:hypothetical protein HYH02_006338 [Chlamydomonas schloesseri]|uniref:Protein kinase domain-containing protein n=1 Tax=Chlamydomonas schloesseri TaxID=2026947 RepID=A0A836B5R2_9CHLO|nr:hypothetical protein HYH02_006338 [Chlamydomonas schloesseri]|eukprot:KAG2448446.1 hypothetical protein HYH02_006338 [Chlamydomonas schloesseri]